MQLEVVLMVYDMNPDYCWSSRSEVSDLLRAVSILGNKKLLVFGRNFWRILVSCNVNVVEEFVRLFKIIDS